MLACADDPIARALGVADDAAHPLVWPLLRCWTWIGGGGCMIKERDSPALIPLVPNPVQMALFLQMLRQAIEGLPIRIIIPKARRHGVSTIIQAIYRYLCAHYGNRQALTYAHTDVDTGKIFELAQLMQSHEDPSIKAAGSKLAWTHGSLYECRTASTKGVSHGSTIDYAHVSELALIERKSGLDKAAMMGIRKAVAKSPHTISIIEGTGKGHGGAFHDMCMDALKGIGEYTLMFFAWFDDPRSIANVPPDFDLTEYEQSIADANHLTMEQMAWYRAEFTAYCGDGNNAAAVALFQHECPSSVEECFTVAKGRVYPGFTRPKHVPKPPEAEAMLAMFAEQQQVIREYRAAVDRGDSYLPPEPQWEFYRAIDWGAGGEHPFVCIWVAHDAKAPPSLSVLPSCEDAINEFMDYARDHVTGRPKKEHDHALDALRDLVASLNLRGRVVIYRLYYDRMPPALPRIARTIHELSGWTQPDGSDAKDLSAYAAGDTGELYGLTVADRARPDCIGTFTSWGIPMIGHKPPTARARTAREGASAGEVEDGIALVSALIAGEAWFIPPPPPSNDDIAKEAVECLSGRADPWGFGRPINLTRQQREALQAVMDAEEY